MQAATKAPPTSSRGSLRRLQTLALAVLLALTSCKSVKFIADYDPVIDQGLQGLLTSGLALGKSIRDTPAEERQYSNFEDQYGDMLTEVEGLRARANKVDPELNKLTIEQLDLLADNITAWRDLHSSEDTLNDAIFEPLEANYTQQVLAIIHLQVAMKRTDSGAPSPAPTDTPSLPQP